MSETSQNFVLWEPEYSHRGTFSIVATCFTTLGICLWSSLHLSIPQRKYKWKRAVGVKLGWMAVGLFLPELLILTAAAQRIQAAKLRDEINTHFGLMGTQRPWYQRWFQRSSTATTDEDIDEERTLIRGSQSSDFSDISSLRSDATSQDTVNEKMIMGLMPTLPFPRHNPGRHRWTLVHGFYAVMGGYAIYDRHDKLCILNGKFVKDLLRRRPELIPNLSEDTILDKSKADGLAKALLFTQIGWFCISCINRLALHYPLTLLEVSALTHALCSIVVYILWWDKPLNIQEPLIIYDLTLLEEYGLPVRTGSWLEIEESSDPGPGPGLSIILIISLVYGAPHLLGWNSAFATHMEQLLWRVSSCAVTGAGIFFFVVAFIAYLFEKCVPSDSRTFQTLGWTLLLISSLAYFSANLYLIAASLRQLFHLRPAAFKTPVWSNYFPHFA